MGLRSADTPDGKHDFYELLRKRVPVTFWCFDILSLRGQDLRELPLSERREQLLGLLLPKPLMFSDTFDAPCCASKTPSNSGLRESSANASTSPTAPAGVPSG